MLHPPNDKHSICCWTNSICPGYCQHAAISTGSFLQLLQMHGPARAVRLASMQHYPKAAPHVPQQHPASWHGALTECPHCTSVVRRPGIHGPLPKHCLTGPLQQRSHPGHTSTPLPFIIIAHNQQQHCCAFQDRHVPAAHADTRSPTPLPTPPSATPHNHTLAVDPALLLVGHPPGRGMVNPGAQGTRVTPVTVRPGKRAIRNVKTTGTITNKTLTACPSNCLCCCFVSRTRHPPACRHGCCCCCCWS